MYQGLAFDLQATVQAVTDAGLFVSLATFKRRPAVEPVTDPSGWVDTVPADYTPVTGLIDIPCMLAVYSDYKPEIAGVVKMEQELDTKQWRHLLLNGYYPTILREDIVNVDGVDYQLMSGAEFDSQAVMTRAAVRTYRL